MDKIIRLLAGPTWQTLYMVGASSFFSFLMGLPLGIALVLTEKGGLCENTGVSKILDVFVNVFRSFPFIILMIILFPLTSCRFPYRQRLLWRASCRARLRKLTGALLKRPCPWAPA